MPKAFRLALEMHVWFQLLHTCMTGGSLPFDVLRLWTAIFAGCIWVLCLDLRTYDYIWLYSCVYSGWAVPTLTSHLESVGTKQAQWAMQQPATATLKSGAALMSLNRQARPRAIPCQRPPCSTVDRIALEITNWWSLIGNGQQRTRFAVHENKLTIYACDATGACCHLFIIMLTHAHRYQ
jgi:hypothetical protein